MSIRNNHEVSGLRGPAARALAAVACCAAALMALGAPAEAGKRSKAKFGAADGILDAVKYPDTSTFSCRTDAIPISPGQNLNLFGVTETCPNAEKLSGPASASTFASGSTAEGYVTRFKPSMVEIKPGGLVTPSVWDLHLHHVVWLDLGGGGPTFASGEEKTTVKLPRGYGYEAAANETWGLNYMVHSLNAREGRQVYITWEIDWVPTNSPSADAIDPVSIRWLDVAGAPQLYPVFDAQRSFDLDGDGRWTFPDDVPTDPAAPGYEERGKISGNRQWVLQNDRTLVFGAGHLHPGGLHVDLEVARDGPDAGSADGDSPSEVRQLFRSDARYYEPAGAVSWDVSMDATRPEWRVSLEAGDTVSISTAYDVSEASWYESMGIMPLAFTSADDATARDPFDDDAEVRAMYERGGILTHGRLRENIDAKANRKLGLPKPKKLRSAGPLAGPVEIEGFLYSDGGFSALKGFPEDLMRPPTIAPGQGVTFTNLDAQPSMAQDEQVWHSITPCPAPCNRGSGIGYPLARGPVEFDSGQLGFGTGTSSEVTTGSDSYTTPAFTEPGTYTYFCRIHPVHARLGPGQGPVASVVPDRR